MKEIRKTIVLREDTAQSLAEIFELIDITNRNTEVLSWLVALLVAKMKGQNSDEGVNVEQAVKEVGEEMGHLLEQAQKAVAQQSEIFQLDESYNLTVEGAKGQPQKSWRVFKLGP